MWCNTRLLGWQHLYQLRANQPGHSGWATTLGPKRKGVLLHTCHYPCYRTLRIASFYKTTLSLSRELNTVSTKQDITATIICLPRLYTLFCIFACLLKMFKAAAAAQIQYWVLQKSTSGGREYCRHWAHCRRGFQGWNTAGKLWKQTEWWPHTNLVNIIRWSLLYSQ